MLGIHDYGVFVAAGILLNLTPGQDTFYILGRSIAHGQRIGVVSVLEIALKGFREPVKAYEVCDVGRSAVNG